ncbi:MAG: hypothetical protein WB795_03905 [Candidatus Acidiferrales bacterium]
MIYSKPEVTVLGDAVRVIQGSKAIPPNVESPLGEHTASYEPEE